MPKQPKTIAILALPGVQLLDVSGPLDVFAEANTQAGERAYRLRVVASAPGYITSSSGVKIVPDVVLSDRSLGNVDTLLVAGAPNAAEMSCGEGVLQWLRKTAATARRFGSVCTGAFFLARAGLLHGKRVATHWAVADELARVFPSVQVEADAIHLHDGRVRTSAGVTAGLDLALALVEEDLGRAVALAVAAKLVMYFKRTGGQSQLSRTGKAVLVGRSALQELQRWAAAHLAFNLSVPMLAGRMGLSARHFSRLFVQEMGVSPAAWVEQMRVAEARRLLESPRSVPKQVASQCGFCDTETFRRAFTRLVGITPAEYRKRARRPPRQL